MVFKYIEGQRNSMTEETERSMENKEEASKTTKKIKYKYLTHNEYQEFLNKEHTDTTIVDNQAKTIRYLPEGKTKEDYERGEVKLKSQDLTYRTSDKKYHPVIKAQKEGGYEPDSIIEQIFFRVINQKVGIDIVKRESGKYHLRQLSLTNGKPTIQSKHHDYGVSRQQLILPKDKDTLESIKQGIDKIIEETQPLPDGTESIKDVNPKVATQEEAERKELIENAVR